MGKIVEIIIDDTELEELNKKLGIED